MIVGRLGKRHEDRRHLHADELRNRARAGPRDREAVLGNVALLVERCGLQHLCYKVLFSLRRYKQRGARYLPAAEAPAELPRATGAP